VINGASGSVVFGGGVLSDYSLAEDSDLVAAIAGGRDAALSVLYDRYHRQCFSFGLRILGSQPDAEEAVQETFVRVWRSAAQYDRSKAAVPGWILSITRNLCIDELRRRRRRAPELPSLEGAFELPGSDRTDLEAERAIVGAQVREALKGLSSEQRSAIELVYFHGLTSQEVGSVLNVPSPTIRSRLRLGLLKLGSVLQAEGLMSID
jgi:RNA polymerase sigma-70 factor, ECF subfamily